MGLELPGIFPSNSSVDRLPLPSPGSLGLVPRAHRYDEELRLPAAPSAGLVCLARRYQPRSLLRSRGRGAPRLHGPGHTHGVPGPTYAGGGRTSQVPGRPQCTHALISDSGEASAPGWGCPPRRSGAAFRLRNGVGPHKMCNFGAQWHGLHASCVRFVVRVTPAPRNTRFRLVASLCRTGWLPAGSERRFQPIRILPLQVFPGALPTSTRLASLPP